MRNSIRRKRHRMEKDRLVTFIAFFVVAPLISIVLGFAIVKFLVIPTFLPVQDETNQLTNQGDINDNIDGFEQEEYQPNYEEDNNQNETTQVKQSEIEGIVLYNLQVGNFSSEENANNLIKELNSKEMLGYLVKGDSYIVFAGTYLTRAEADKYLPEVKISYNDAFISTFSLQDKVITYNSDEENSANNLIEVMNAINNAYNEELSLWYKALETNEIKLLLDEMASNSNNFKTLIAKVNTELKSEQLMQLDGNLEKYIEARDNIISNLNEDGESLKQSLSNYNEIYYKCLNLTK